MVNMVDKIWDKIRVNFVSQYLTAEKLTEYLLVFIKIIAILIASKIILRFLKFSVDKLFDGSSNFKGFNYNQRRLNTIKPLIHSVLRYGIYFIAGAMILGVPASSIVTGAGVVGLAVGFGAQNLVKDIISGFFILFENQFSVGDYVQVGDMEGIVQEIGLRITRIKDFNGEIHIIPNGKIEIVTNYMDVENIRVMFDIGVSYDEDIDYVIQVLEDISKGYALDNKGRVVEGPTVMGVQELAGSSVNIRMMARVQPMEQWAVERELKKRIKNTFDEKGIDIPFPQRVLHFKQSTDNVNDQVNS